MKRRRLIQKSQRVIHIYLALRRIYLDSYSNWAEYDGKYWSFNFREFIIGILSPQFMGNFSVHFNCANTSINILHL